MISRRKFILSILILGGAILLGFFIVLDLEKAIRKILKKELSYLNMKPEVIDKFIKQTHEEGYWDYLFSREKKLFILVFFALSNKLFTLPYQYKYEQLKSRIIGDFLLSTNFFLNRMDEKKEVRYLGLYDPYKRPCTNPFSDLIYSS